MIRTTLDPPTHGEDMPQAVRLLQSRSNTIMLNNRNLSNLSDCGIATLQVIRVNQAKEHVY